VGDFVKYKNWDGWLHFLQKKDRQPKKTENCAGWSTKGLHEHLKRVHDKTLDTLCILRAHYTRK